MTFIKFITNKKTLAFIGGFATAVIGAKAAKSQAARKAVVHTVAGGIKVYNGAVSALETIKEDAQDLYNEANACEKEKTDEA